MLMRHRVTVLHVNSSRSSNHVGDQSAVCPFEGFVTFEDQL